MYEDTYLYLVTELDSVLRAVSVIGKLTVDSTP
jgi:hypothetical protein